LTFSLQLFDDMINHNSGANFNFNNLDRNLTIRLKRLKWTQI